MSDIIILPILSKHFRYQLIPVEENCVVTVYQVSLTEEKTITILTDIK